MKLLKDTRSQIEKFKENTNEEKALGHSLSVTLLSGVIISAYYEFFKDVWIYQLDAVIGLGVITYLASLYYYKS